MKLKNLSIAALLLVMSASVYGNDSTLHQQRMARIKQLAEWLGNHPFPFVSNAITVDSIKACSLYDTAMGLFLSKSPIEEKLHPKSGLFYLDRLLNKLPVNDMLLKQPHPERETTAEVKSFTSYLRNTIVLYLPMYNEEFEGIYFAFADNTADLIYILEAGGEERDYVAKKRFLNSLKAMPN
jgi:hypothetical protein